MSTFHPESVDLAVLATDLRAMLATAPEGPIVGRTVLRDAVVARLACSALEAERVVDTMVQRGFAHLETSPDGRSVWRLRPGP